VDVVSPELALVDPELAARARLALPFPRDCLARPEPFSARDDATAIEAARLPRRPSLLVALVSLLAASLIGVPGGAGAALRSTADACRHVLQQASAAATP